MIISSCPRFRMFFPNCLSPILDDFPIIVIISPHSRISGFSGCRKIIFLSFSCWSGDIWSFRDQQSIISIYFYIFLYISIRFHRSCRKNWSIRFGQCILPSPGIKMASFPRQSLGRACALVWWFRGFPGHQKT
jgi:hypothetical protein